MAVALGQLCATHRSDATLLAGDATGGLGASTGCTSLLGVDAVAAYLRAGGAVNQLELPLAPASGLAVLDTAAADPASVVDVLHRLGRRHAVTITDVGVEVDAPAVADAHAVVLVVPTSVRGQRALPQLLAAVGHHAPGSGVLLVAVDLGVDTGVPASSVVRAVAAQTAGTSAVGRGPTALRLPADRHLAGGAELVLSRTAERTRLALTEITAAVLVTAGVGSGSGRPR